MNAGRYRPHPGETHDPPLPAISVRNAERTRELGRSGRIRPVPFNEGTDRVCRCTRCGHITRFHWFDAKDPRFFSGHPRTRWCQVCMAFCPAAQCTAARGRRSSGAWDEGAPDSPTPAILRVAAEIKRLGKSEWDWIGFCHRSNGCSVSRCPLDPLVELRSRRPDDAENGCPLSRATRERIFALLPVEMRALLPFGGLLEPEFNRRKSARARYAALPPERRAELAARGAVALQKARLSFRPDPTAPGSSDSPSGQPSPAQHGTNGGETA